MGTTSISPEPLRRGGRGARERILKAAARLFYEEGINATGMARLVEVAQVSTRTFYQHFPSKNALVQEYLRRFDTDFPSYNEQQLQRSDLAPRERLLAVFSEQSGTGRIRGCPFHNAAVEAADALPDIQELVQRHKRTFIQALIDTAAQAGADDPQILGCRLAVLFEGAAALSTSLDDSQPVRDARDTAVMLIDLATTS
jgi:AcrR family transcriptional regulator